jgi:hypothetical protein
MYDSDEDQLFGKNPIKFNHLEDSDDEVQIFKKKNYQNEDYDSDMNLNREYNEYHSDLKITDKVCEFYNKVKSNPLKNYYFDSFKRSIDKYIKNHKNKELDDYCIGVNNNFDNILLGLENDVIRKMLGEIFDV